MCRSQSDTEVESLVNGRRPLPRDDDARGRFLDNAGPFDAMPGQQGRTPVYGRVHEPSAVGKVDGSLVERRGGTRRTFLHQPVGFVDGASGTYTVIHELNRILGPHTEQKSVQMTERLFDIQQGFRI